MVEPSVQESQGFGGSFQTPYTRNSLISETFKQKQDIQNLFICDFVNFLRLILPPCIQDVPEVCSSRPSASKFLPSYDRENQGSPDQLNRHQLIFIDLQRFNKPEAMGV